MKAQITKIDCENILGLKNISKLTIGTKKINPKENRHKTLRITWFGNSLHPRVTTNKFHYIKFGITQIGVRHSYKPKSQIHSNSSLSQIQKTKEPNTNQRTKGSHIPNTNCAQTKERATNQIQNLQHTKREQITKLQNQNQVVTSLSHYFKLQPMNIK